MNELGLPMLLGLLMISSAASLIVLWCLGFLRRRSDPAPFAVSDPERKNTFLFKNGVLIDHDVQPLPPSLAELDSLSDWNDLRGWLGLRFADLPDSLAALPEGDSVFTDQIDPHSGLEILIQRHGSTTHIILSDKGKVSPAMWHCASHASQIAHDAQDVLDHAPFPIWKSAPDGTITWRNSVLARVVNELGAMPLIPPEDQSGPTLPRFSVPRGGVTPPRWYEVSSHKLQNDETLYVGSGIDQVIRAESAQRDFVQTLTKTFANLTTGLAVFDKNSQLALFNPALVDLTGISVSFLSARPEVIRFFDELRERQVLPEPKNYADLRSHIRDVITRAHKGNYLEVWNLPGGVTYRVTGRPHPDGAVAFLIEDISAEVLKTRQFRSQIDLGQSVLDGIEDAVVVIAPNDMILLCNTACTELLKIDPGASFAEMSVTDLLRACRDQFHSDALWAIFEANLRDGAAPSDTPYRFLNGRSGERYRYQIKTLPGGVRMVNFGTPVSLSALAPVSAAE